MWRAPSLYVKSCGEELGHIPLFFQAGLLWGSPSTTSTCALEHRAHLILQGGIYSQLQVKREGEETPLTSVHWFSDFKLVIWKL